MVLQPELDINKEVQKRGRINRTGQISKPIYDYLTSAIPAETRLMMMLKKKLKSLDANTTSSQKQSSKLMESEDFLNKYGDRVVVEYMKENTDLHRNLGEPLGDDFSKTENAGTRITGRVAIMPVETQKKFYSEIIQRYNDYVDYLRQMGEYDLEVEVMNLEAEIKSSQVVVAGKGGSSVFSTDTTLERSQCNVLKKPFMQNELKAMIEDVLENRTPEQYREHLIRDFESVTESVFNNQLQGQKEKFEVLRNKIREDKAYESAETEEERQSYYEYKLDEINTRERETLTKMRSAFEYRNTQLRTLFKFFTPGKDILFPDGNSHHKAVFIGFNIDKSRDNPYLPSAVKARIAVASSIKYLALTASGDQGAKLMEIIGLGEPSQHVSPTGGGILRFAEVGDDFIVTVPREDYDFKKMAKMFEGQVMRFNVWKFDISQKDSVKGIARRVYYDAPEESGMETLPTGGFIDQWNDLIKESAVNRSTRYIVTGNLLQAVGKFGKGGKLVSYTTIDGREKKGYLLPEGYDPDEEGGKTVRMGIYQALEIIKGLTPGNNVGNKDIQLAISKTHNYDYQIAVPAAKARAGYIYLHQPLLDAVRGGNFDKVSGFMRATVDAENIEKAVKALAEIGISLEVSQSMFELMNISTKTVKEFQSKYRTSPIVAFEAKALKERELSL